MSAPKDGEPHLFPGNTLGGQEGLEVEDVHALLDNDAKRSEEDGVLGGDVPRAPEVGFLGLRPRRPGNVRGQPVGEEGVDEVPPRWRAPVPRHPLGAERPPEGRVGEHPLRRDRGRRAQPSARDKVAKAPDTGQRDR
eukprot:3274092-Alexandrium_andersonii.AAC.1